MLGLAIWVTQALNGADATLGGLTGTALLAPLLLVGVVPLLRRRKNTRSGS